MGSIASHWILLVGLVSSETLAGNVRLLHNTLLTDALEGPSTRLVAGSTYVVQGVSQDPLMNTPVSLSGVAGSPLIVGPNKENIILDTVGLTNAHFRLGNSSFLSYFCSVTCSGSIDLVAGAQNATLRITGSYTLNTPLPGEVSLQLTGSGQVTGPSSVLMSPLQIFPGTTMKLNTISVVALRSCGSGSTVSLAGGDGFSCP